MFYFSFFNLSSLFLEGDKHQQSFTYYKDGIKNKKNKVTMQIVERGQSSYFVRILNKINCNKTNFYY